VTLKVSVVEEKPERATLKFEIKDTGIGLSPEQAGALFQPFTQAESSTTRRFGGTGLGLVISKRLAEMMGGRIWVESELGLGSTFAFTADFGLHASDKRYVARRKDFRGLTALLVDDNQVALEIMDEFLKTLGFIVKTAGSGAAAIGLLQDWSRRGRKFDLLIIDWKMPEMDGLETSDRIHEITSPKDLPVIIMSTAYNRDDVLSQAHLRGIRHVMTKPLSPSTVLNVLMDIFGRSLAAKESKLKKAHGLVLAKECLGARILLAEDDAVNQLVASRILTNAGLKVDIANNGLEALSLVQEKTYDLVLMDIQMPGMDGLTAARKIRELPSFGDLPIVAMTAHAMSGDRELSFAAGMNDHINKPINVEELFSVLAHYLSKKPKYS
jgi:CheY-like chemotaxis protein